MVEPIERLEEFFRGFYEGELLSAAAAGKKSITVDFMLLDKFDPELADKLLAEPREMVKAASSAIAGIDTPKGSLELEVRFKNLPDSSKIRIRNLRSEHIGSFVCIDGVVRKASEVMPEISVAIFQCPSCTKLVDVIQKERTVKPPNACDGCGYKGKMEMVDKKIFDSRWLVVEEPFDVATAEKQGNVKIYLKSDLTSPEMQRKCDPGSRLTINGILKEMIRKTRGTMKTQMDMFVDANYIEPTEIEWEEVIISEEDEEKIKEMATDPKIYEKLIASIAPTIYGLDEVKEAMVHQLFGGVKRIAPDGTRLRGDIHILLVGDPAVGKSVSADCKLLHCSAAGRGCSNIGALVDEQISRHSVHLDGGAEISLNKDGVRVLALDSRTHKAEWVPVTAFIRHRAPEYMYKITTRSGRCVIGTGDHSFLTLDAKGDIRPIQGDKLGAGMYLPVPLGAHKEGMKELDIGKWIERRTNALPIRTMLALDRNFGFFLGLFLAEGSLTKGTLFIDNKNKELKRRAAGWLRKTGMKPNIKSERLFACSRSFCDFLREVCYSGKKTGRGKGSGARRKCVPDFTYFAPAEFVEGILSGIFSGDGYFTSSKSAPNLNNLQIGLTTTSKELAKGVLELLATLGVFAKLREKKYRYRGTIRRSWEISMTGPAVNMFMRKIGIVGKRPKSMRVSEKDALDSLPCGGLLYSIVRELGYSRRLVGDSKQRRAFAAMMRTVRARNRIGRRRLERIYRKLAEEAEKQGNEKAKQLLTKLERLLTSNIVWDPIVKVEKIRSEDEFVYDLSIDGKETFVANGIAVHNTQLLKLVSRVLPRGKYVSGKGVTGVGLTASVTKDEEFMGGWVLEAGAMVLCHKGLIAIDEFDKMNRDDQIAMHEAMSTQTISIAKATIVATLPAQTAVLAGANPKLSRFDLFKSISDQIDIPDTLLSRFDLKFALLDRPQREYDEKIADHIMYSRMKPEKMEPPITPELMRKYIAYARYTSVPVFTKEAAERLKRFYIEMRGLYKEQTDSIPVTARQQEALVRLSEASARIRLSDKVELQDAERAIRLMKYSLQQLAFDQKTGKFDIDRTEGVSASKRNMRRMILEIVDKLEKTLGKKIPRDEIHAECTERGINLRDAEEIIEDLIRDGTLMYPDPRHVSKTR